MRAAFLVLLLAACSQPAPAPTPDPAARRAAEDAFIRHHYEDAQRRGLTPEQAEARYTEYVLVRGEACRFNQALC